MFSTADAAVPLAARSIDTGPDDTHRTTAAARRPRVLPSRALTAVDLLRLTDAYAARVLDGEFAFLYPRDGQLPADSRWRVLLFGDGDVDVWLIGWPPGVVADLHDHGDSEAAVTIVVGELTEDWLLPGGRLVRRVLVAGDQRSYPAGHTHRVGNDQRSGSVFSVHAYSPPLPEIRAVVGAVVEGGR